MRSALLLVILVINLKIYSQTKFCADSSIRIKYTFNRPNGEFFINPDTSGNNIFVGRASPNNIIAFKTDWGENILWANNYSSAINPSEVFNSFDAPNGTFITTGSCQQNGVNDFMICRIDTNGNLLWAKRYRLNSLNLHYSNGASIYKNIFVNSNAIYFTATMTDLNVVVKLDLNGNVIWSKGFP